MRVLYIRFPEKCHAFPVLPREVKLHGEGIRMSGNAADYATVGGTGTGDEET